MLTVTPTTTGRIGVLDTLRGAAILGILVANIAYYSGPAMSELAARGTPGGGWVGTLTLVFVNAKFRTMLAILFGVGIWMQYEKRRHAYPLWPGGYLKRAFWLSVIGLLHGCLIWFGDILFIYSNVAVLIALIVAWPERKLRRLLVLLAIVSLFVAAGLAALIRIALPLDGPKHPESAAPVASPREVRGPASIHPVATAEPNTAFEVALAALQDPAVETRIFREGNFAEQTLTRSLAFVASVTQTLFFLPELAGLFLLGLLLARRGGPAGSQQTPSHP